MKALVLLFGIHLLGSLGGCRVATRGADDPSQSPDLVMVEAADWDELVYTTQGSEITLLSTGHFYVEPNSCYRKESGVIELAQWNRIATVINRAWGADFLEQSRCISSPPGVPNIINGVNIRLWNATPQKAIDSINSSQICSRIADEEGLRNLALALKEVADLARQEGC